MKHILLVDDDCDDMELFKEALQEVNPACRFQYFDNGPGALAHLELAKELPDFIFLDINLPILNGWEVLKKLRSTPGFSQVPVIIYTTSNSERERQVAKDLGAMRFITKPSDYEILKSLIRSFVSS